MPRPACPLAHVLASVLALSGIGSLDLTLGAGFFHEIADEVFQGSRKWLLTIDPLPVLPVSNQFPLVWAPQLRRD